MSLWVVGWFTTQSSIPVLHIVNLLSVAIVHRNLKCFPAFRTIQREIKRVFQLDLSCHFQQWAFRLFRLAHGVSVVYIFSGSQSTEGYLWSGLASMVPYTDPQTIKSTYRFGTSFYIQHCGKLLSIWLYFCFYSVLIQIIHTDSNTVLGQNDTGFSCDGSANTFRVMFKEPVEILPNVNYTACATLKVCCISSYHNTVALLKRSIAAF